jgi:hypothetical protein
LELESEQYCSEFLPLCGSFGPKAVYFRDRRLLPNKEDLMRATRRRSLWLLCCLAAVFVVGCCTQNTGQLVAPTVVSFSPTALSNMACPNATVSIGFSEAMNPATINSTTFTLAGAGNVAVAGTVTFNTTTNVALFTPTALLTAGVTYTASLSTAVSDQYGNKLAVAYTNTFTTAANGCHPPPTVVSVVPALASMLACPNATVIVTFSEAMNPATINASDFTLSGGVIGTVTHDPTNTIYTLTPSSVLASGTLYTTSITTAAEDTYGNFLAAPFTSTFTTAANGCHPAPTITAVTPAPGATGVCPNSVITTTFSEAMTPSTINATTFTVTGTGGAAVTGTVSYNTTTNTAIFTPSAALSLNTTFTATMSAGVEDTYGNFLATKYSWTFATGANTCLPPTPPVSVTPAPGATGLCPLSVVSATFPQAMNPATLNTNTFTVAAGGVKVAGTVTADATNKIFTFTPAQPLALSTLYTVTITTGAQDPFGNALATNYTWTFTTGATTCTGATPVVVTTSPLANAIGVCPNVPITATFSIAMNPATINTGTFLISGTTGVVTVDSTDEIGIFTPTTTLALNTAYIGTITTGAQSSTGNALAAPYTWNFTTSTQICQPPVQLGSAANFVILGASTVTSTGPTVITGGNLGLSPGSAVTGFPPGSLITPAVMHLTDPVAAQAQLDLTIAYNYAAGLPNGAVLPAHLAGLTFTPGLYKNATTVDLTTGTVTLDAQGNPNAVFIFQIGTTLTTLGSTQVLLVGGAQAKNVFWQVGSSATIGTGATFNGTILALQSITLQTGAVLNGRALASNGAVTMDSNIVTAP